MAIIKGLGLILAFGSLLAIGPLEIDPAYCVVGLIGGLALFAVAHVVSSVREARSHNRDVQLDRAA